MKSQIQTRLVLFFAFLAPDCYGSMLRGKSVTRESNTTGFVMVLYENRGSYQVSSGGIQLSFSGDKSSHLFEPGIIQGTIEPGQSILWYIDDVSLGTALTLCLNVNVIEGDNERKCTKVVPDKEHSTFCFYSKGSAKRNNRIRRFGASHMMFDLVYYKELGEDRVIPTAEYEGYATLPCHQRKLPEQQQLGAF
jgi:hypothetical protein